MHYMASVTLSASIGDKLETMETSEAMETARVSTNITSVYATGPSTWGPKRKRTGTYDCLLMIFIFLFSYLLLLLHPQQVLKEVARTNAT